MKKRAAVLFLAVVLAVTLCPPAPALAAPPAQPYPFPDVAEDHWSYTYVLDLYEQEVLGGYPDGRFHPRDTLTWGQSFKLILGAIDVELPEREPGQHWAYSYIEPAIDNRLVYSFDEGSLDEAPTRRDVARMVARALDLTDISGESPYTDCDDGYVVELYEKSIMWGTAQPDGTRTFSPDEPIAREEMAAIIWRMMHTDVSEGMFRYNNYWLDVLEDVPATTFSKEQFSKDEKGRVTYSGGYFTRGIDVSGHKREIDWQAVAADGIDFAIIRAGNRLYGKDSTAAIYDDSWFERNMDGAIAAGLDVGAYFFSSAITVEEAIEEADFFLAKLEPYREHVTYPVVCDWEFLGGAQSRAYGVDAKIITECVDAFCRRVAEAGYQPMFYFNTYCGYVKFDLSRLTQYPFWFAEYASTPSCIYNFQMWQYSSSGKVAGISSDVDMDLCFVPYGSGAQRPDTDWDSPPEPEPTSYLPTEPMIP